MARQRRDETAPNRNLSGWVVTCYGKEGFGIHGRPEGSVMTVRFRLGDQEFTALNGGPRYKFTEAISFVVRCETQAEVDHTGINWARAVTRRRSNAAG